MEGQTVLRVSDSDILEMCLLGNLYELLSKALKHP